MSRRTALRIYDFPRGARGLRAAWLCEEMGLDWEFVPVGFPPDEAYRAIDPMGRVPRLVDGAVSMGESVAIMLHIARRHGPTPLLPDDPAAHARTLEMAVFGETSLADPMDVLLMVRYGAPAGETGGWAASATRNRLMRSMRHLEQIVERGPFLVGDGPTLADISVATALQIWRTGLHEELPPTLSTYLELLQQRPAYRAAADRSAGASADTPARP